MKAEDDMILPKIFNHTSISIEYFRQGDNDAPKIDRPTYLLGLVFALNGAPGFSLALGYCDKYVIIDISSILGSTISSGLMSCSANKIVHLFSWNKNREILTWGMLSQSSARPMASDAFWTASFGFQSCQSGQSPGATASTSAPTALPSFQSDVKFPMGKSGTLAWIQCINLCFGVAPLSAGSPSSPSHIGIDIE